MIRVPRGFLVAFAVALSVAVAGACGAPRSDRGADAAPIAYPLAKLWRGADAAAYTAEERASLQRGHMASIGTWSQQRVLLVAGPFGSGGPNEDLRGLYVFAPGTADVRGLVAHDPAIDAGVLRVEWSTLHTTHDLAAALERYFAAAERAGGSQDEVRAATMRMYTVVWSRDGDAVERVLDQRAKIVLAGRIDGGPGGFHVLDEQDTAAVREWLAGAEYEVYPWYGSAELAAPPAR